MAAELNRRGIRSARGGDLKVKLHAMSLPDKSAVPQMKPGSAIINTASVNSERPESNVAGVCHHQRRDLESHLRAGTNARRESDSWPCDCARADLDTADPVEMPAHTFKISASRRR
jgi:hypothetical protein